MNQTIASNEAANLGEQLILHEKQIYNTILRIVGNSHDAEDLTQETFLKAVRSIAGFRGEAKLSTWLHRIAVNTALDYMRYNGSSQTVSIEQSLIEDQATRIVFPPMASAEKTDPEIKCQKHGLEQLIEQCIQRLPETYRTVLVLRDIQGFSVKETAEIMECSIGLAKWRLNKARKLLKAFLSQQNSLKGAGEFQVGSGGLV